MSNSGWIHGRSGRRITRIGAIGATVIASSLVFVPSAPVAAAGIVVTTTADVIDAAANCSAVTIASLPGPGATTSLREAVCAANNTAGDDVITFAVNGTFVLTGTANDDSGNSGDLDVSSTLTIEGNGAANTIVDGGSIERIFDVFPASPIAFTLADLTVQHGDTRTTGFKQGGAIYLHNNVTATLTNVDVVNNFSGANGAIDSLGSLTMSGSKITANQTDGGGSSVTAGGIRIAGPATITGSTISNNSVQGEGGGAFVTVAPSVTVAISGTTFADNSATVTGGGLGNGGAIATTGNEGTLDLTNVTISGNHADNDGGGVYIAGTGSVHPTNVTITNNTADFENNAAGTGGGIHRNSSTATLLDTIVAGNFNSTAAVRDDIAGSVGGSNNLVGDGTGSSGLTNGLNGNIVGSGGSPVNPLLGAIAANGGPTLTHALLAGSPAINAGNNATCAATDQRGVVRAFGGATCDIGSFELADTAPPDTFIDTQPVNPVGSSAATFTFHGTDTGGSGLAGFECQIDGGGFTSCTSPKTYLSLADGSHTFQVRAVDGVGNRDATPASYTWTSDITAPDTTITAYPTNPSSSTSASFSFTGTDGAGSGVADFECQIDGGGFTSCTTPQTYSGLSQGSHTFQVRAIDNVGQVDATPASYTWVIDTIAPDTTITANPPNPSNSANAAFSFTGNDASGSGVAGFQCQLDGGGFSSCTSPQTGVGLPDGVHTFDVRAVDAAGNVDPSPASYTWMIDATGPDTSFTATPNDPTNDTAASFSFTGNDGSGLGVASFECALDAGPWSPCTSPTALSGLSEGVHTFQARAVDALDNVDPTPASYTWTIDVTGPDTFLAGMPADPTSSVDATFAISSSEPFSTFECKLDAEPFTACSSSESLIGLAEGPHTFQARATDAAGNTDPTPASYSWVIDTTAPDTIISTTPPNPSNSASAGFSFTGSDAGGSGVASFECQLDGGGFAPCTSPQNFTSLDEGTHTFDVRAIDAAGNVDATPATYSWVVDTLDPTTTITATPSDPSPSADAVFDFEGDGTGTSVTFECSLDGAAFTACTSGTTYTSLSDGSHTFEVQAVDGADNVDPTPASYTWVIDTADPTTSITSNPLDPTSDVDATFTFTGDDGGGTGVASFECSLDGASFATCTSPVAYTALTDGTHLFQVRAIDDADNADATPAAFTWLIDTVAPETSITSGPPALTANTSATISFGGIDPQSDSGSSSNDIPLALEPGSGVASFACSLDGAAATPCSSPVTLAGLTNGSHTFEVAAIDGAGNEDATPASITWTVDTAAGPTLTANKTVTGTFQPGGAVTYTIVVTNNGSLTQQDNPGDELVDVLPATLQLVSATATSGTATAEVATRTVHWNGSLAPSASVTITVSATVSPSATAGQTISNQATLAFDFDDNGSNESSGTSDNPSTSGADATTFVLSAAPVQTTVPSTTAPSGGLPPTGGNHAQSGVMLALVLVGLGISLVGVRRRHSH